MKISTFSPREKNIYTKIFILSTLIFGIWVSCDFGMLAGVFIGILFGIANCSLIFIHRSFALKENIPLPILCSLIGVIGLPWMVGIFWQLVSKEKVTLMHSIWISAFCGFGFGSTIYSTILASHKIKGNIQTSWRKILFLLIFPFGLSLGIFFIPSQGLLAGITIGIFAALILLLIVGFAFVICKVLDKINSRSVIKKG